MGLVLQKMWLDLALRTAFSHLLPKPGRAPSDPSTGRPPRGFKSHTIILANTKGHPSDVRLCCERTYKRTFFEERTLKRNILQMGRSSHPICSAKSIGAVSACSALFKQVLIASELFPAFFSSSTLVYHSGFRQRYSISAESFSISENR